MAAWLDWLFTSGAVGPVIAAILLAEIGLLWAFRHRFATGFGAMLCSALAGIGFAMALRAALTTPQDHAAIGLWLGLAFIAHLGDLAGRRA